MTKKIATPSPPKVSKPRVIQASGSNAEPVSTQEWLTITMEAAAKRRKSKLFSRGPGGP